MFHLLLLRGALSVGSTMTCCIGSVRRSGLIVSTPNNHNRVVYGNRSTSCSVVVTHPHASTSMQPNCIVTLMIKSQVYGQPLQTQMCRHTRGHRKDVSSDVFHQSLWPMW